MRYGGRRERLDPRDPLPANQKAPLKMPQMCVCLEMSWAIGCACRWALTRSAARGGCTTAKWCPYIYIFFFLHPKLKHLKTASFLEAIALLRWAPAAVAS
jgi:hypothetical protein